MKNKIKQAVLTVTLVSVALYGKGQEKTTSYTLQEAIDYSLKNSSNFLNANLDLESAAYKRKEIAGVGLPQINGSVDIKDYLALPTSLLPGQFFGGPAGTYIPVKFGTKYNATAGLTASQLLFSSDYIIGLKAAKEFINLSKINVQRSKIEVVASVSKAYYYVLVNRERVKLLDINMDRLSKIFNDTKALNQQGFVEQIDVERLEVQLNNLKIEKEKTDRLIELSENVLKFQMGYAITDPITLKDSISATPSSAEKLNSGKIDVSNRPDYQLLQSQQVLSKLDVKRKKMSYIPTLAAYGSLQYNAQRQQFDFFDGSKSWYNIALIGAALNFTLFDGFQQHNRIQQAKITVLKNENTMRNVALAAEMEATVADITYTNANASFQIQKRNMELAQHVYDVSQKKYSQGVGSNLELTTAESALKEAQTNYYNSLYDMLVSEIDYKKAVGTLIK